MVANLEMHPSCPLIGPDVVDGVSEVSGGAVVNRVGVVGLLVGGGRRWACTSAAKKQATIEIRFTHIIATSYCLLTGKTSAIYILRQFPVTSALRHCLLPLY